MDSCWCCSRFSERTIFKSMGRRITKIWLMGSSACAASPHFFWQVLVLSGLVLGVQAFPCLSPAPPCIPLAYPLLHPAMTKNDIVWLTLALISMFFQVQGGYKSKTAALLYAPLQQASPVCAIPLVYLPLRREIVTQASEQLCCQRRS